MEITKNTIIESAHNKPILVDIFFNKTNTKNPILIFCHGYKGYKDWGAWNLMAEQIANNKICFVKFNFSHNGGTVEKPIDFPDLEAFGQNNYTKELDDLGTVINWVEKEYGNHTDLDASNIILLGHSRGGGIVTLKAQEDSRISKVISVAGVSDFENRFPKDEALKKWKDDDVMYVVNGRTKQNMPHYYQFYENFIVNAKRLNIKRAASSLKIPHLIIHGDADTSVLPEEAYALHNWNPKSKLSIIKNADHVFNTKHPWEENRLTPQLLEVVDVVLEFIKTP